jgi:predicted metal-dependent peptidase
LTNDIPTAAVGYDVANDSITMGLNPEFCLAQEDSQMKGLLKHEFNHITFGHLSSRKPSDTSLFKLWNIATDCANNSLIEEEANNSSNVKKLPDCVIVPGRRSVMSKEKLDKMSEQEREAHTKFADIIAGLPKLETSEYYFYKIYEKIKDDPSFGGLNGQGNFEISFEPGGGDGSLDSHEFWGNIPEEQREFIEQKIKQAVAEAVKTADRQSNGWGNIPSHVVAEIRRSVTQTINWRTILRQFVGSISRGARTSSIKRINRRYPYIHPGTKRGYQTKLLIAIDQSGSVDDSMLGTFFAELDSLTKKVDVSILPFDCEASESEIIEWKKGSKLDLKRTRMGGTDFNAPSRIFNDQKNRNRWDGMLIMTDGCAPSPEAVRKKRGWVLGKGCKLEFPSSELIINVGDEGNMTGAWR